MINMTSFRRLSSCFNAISRAQIIAKMAVYIGVRRVRIWRTTNLMANNISSASRVTGRGDKLLIDLTFFQQFPLDRHFLLPRSPSLLLNRDGHFYINAFPILETRRERYTFQFCLVRDRSDFPRIS